VKLKTEENMKTSFQEIISIDKMENSQIFG